MRLGVPFIAPRQLGAVENNSGRPSLPSVVGRTGQSGAHRTLSGARFLSLNGAVDRCRSGSRWHTGHVRCPLPTVGLATCRAQTPRPTVGPSRPLAHPVNFSRTPSANSRERPLRPREPGAPDTVRCTTGQSGAPDRNSLLAVHSQLFFFLFLTLRQVY